MLVTIESFLVAYLVSSIVCNMLNLGLFKTTIASTGITLGTMAYMAYNTICMSMTDHFIVGMSNTESNRLLTYMKYINLSKASIVDKVAVKMTETFITYPVLMICGIPLAGIIGVLGFHNAYPQFFMEPPQLPMYNSMYR